jgi:methyl-accepting chemotaxis protein
MSIRVKLICGFILVSILVCVVGVVGFRGTSSVNELSEAIVNNNTIPLFFVLNFTNSFEKNRVTFRDILISFDETDRQKYQTAITDEEKAQYEALDSFIKYTADDASPAVKLVQQIQGSLGEFNVSRQKIIQAVQTGNRDDGFEKLYSPEYQKLSQDIQANIESLKTEIYKSITALTDTQNGIEKSATIMIASVLLLAVLFSNAFGTVLSNSIAKQINVILSAVGAIANGDLTARVSSSSGNELGRLSQNVDNMAEELQFVLSNANDTALLVDDAARQVSSSSMSLAQISTEQASSAQQISASITQIASQTKTNAENAAKASTLSTATMRAASRGREQMHEMLLAMSAINKASVSISDIIKVIEDIAFQTNILALNAAVEAARAGQHGRGFAVVAEEVRTLAARSATAASETTEMIESAAREMASGSKIANETAESLNVIVDEISKAAELVTDISTASTEQSQSIRQINIGVDQVSQAIQTTSSVAQQTASSSSELSTHATTLKNLIAKFILEGEPAGTGRLGGASVGIEGGGGGGA